MRRATILLTLFVTVACSEPLDFADWTVPVPEGTRVIEYAAVPIEERTEVVELVPDLTIGVDPPDSNYAFYRLRDVDVDAEGRIFVLDGGNHRVQVFDSEGEYLRTIGREGQGPGEFQRPVALAVGGERLVVADPGNTRLSIWGLDGVHIADASIDRNKLSTGRLALLSDASVLVNYSHSQSRAEATGTVAQVSWQREDERSLVDVRSMVRIAFRESRNGGDGIRIEAPQPSFAMAPAGGFYLMGGDEYQVVAMTETGDVRWALRVAHEKALFSEMYLEDYIEMLREYDPEVTVAHLEPNRPDFFPALTRILSEGHGHLYVAPYEEQSPGTPPREEVSVDVYSSDGERLFAGWMPNKDWRAARGDFVYAIEPSPDSGEEVVVRYRLVEPF